MKIKLLFITLLISGAANAQQAILEYYGHLDEQIWTADGNSGRSYETATSATPIDQSGTGGGQVWDFFRTYHCRQFILQQFGTYSRRINKLSWN
ncbi:MAG TPA: hypothetical protein VGB50_05715 [Flavobacterium sp.]